MKDKSTEVSAVGFVDDMIRLAIKQGASDIHFEPREHGMSVRIRVDGILKLVCRVPDELKDRVIPRLKVISGMDLTRHRIPQDGRASIDENIDIRVSALPTIHGEKIVVRLLDKLMRPKGAEMLGIEGENLLKYRRLLHCENGLILIAGATGSGKTSTMYQMITDLASDGINIVTLEDPVEYDIPEINQAAINEQTGMTFSMGIRSVLRQDPDVIAIGEIRSPQTAAIAYETAITGHLTLATIHVRNAASLISRMDEMGIKASQLAETLRGVIVQKLIRRLCRSCRGAGCEHCGGTGYAGRTGVFGISEFTYDGKMTLQRLKDCDRALEDNCRSLIIRGVTTELEAGHVFESF